MSGVEQVAPEKRSSMSGLVFGLLCSLAALLFVACPAAHGVGDWSPLAAWLLTFLPGLLILSQASRFSEPVQSSVFTLLAMGFRVIVAFGGGFLLVSLVPDISRTILFGWLGAFYIAALVMEVYLMSRSNSVGSRGGFVVQQAASAQLQEVRR